MSCSACAMWLRYVNSCTLAIDISSMTKPAVSSQHASRARATILVSSSTLFYLLSAALDDTIAAPFGKACARPPMFCVATPVGAVTATAVWLCRRRSSAVIFRNTTLLPQPVPRKFNRAWHGSLHVVLVCEASVWWLTMRGQRQHGRFLEEWSGDLGLTMAACHSGTSRG